MKRTLTSEFGIFASDEKHDPDAIRRQYPELYGEIRREPYTEEDIARYEREYRTPVTETHKDTDTGGMSYSERKKIIRGILNEDKPAKKKDAPTLH
jgi:hypothetical protein